MGGAPARKRKAAALASVERVSWRAALVVWWLDSAFSAGAQVPSLVRELDPACGS